MKTILLFLLSAALASCAVITICPSGCNYTPSQLQTAVNAAVPGDIITIDPSVAASTSSGLSLPVLANPNHLYVTIRSAHIYNLPGGVRVLPTNADLATITDTSVGNHVLYTLVSGGLGSSYFRFEGVKFIGPPNDPNLSIMIQLGQFQYPTFDHEVSQMAHDLIFDRCLFSGYPGSPGPKNAIAMNAGRVTIENSYFYEIKYAGAECHDVEEWNGTGPFTFINNHFEAVTEETIFGGAAPIIAGVRPTAIIRGNEYYKPWAWRYTSGAAVPTGTCMYGADRGGEWYSVSSAGGLIYNCDASNAWATTTEAALAAVIYENPGNYTRAAVDPTGACTSGRFYKNTATSSYWECVSSAWTSITIGPFISGVIGNGGRWYQKNHLELKNAERVTVEGNYIHQAWQPADGQQHGACFLFNQVDNSYAFGGDQSSGIFWSDLRYNRCDSVPWMAATGTIVFGADTYFYPQHDNAIHDNLATNIGGEPFSQGDSLVDQLGVGSRQTFSYNTVITTQLPTTQSQAMQTYLLNQFLSTVTPQVPQEMNVVGNIFGWNWYGLHDGSDGKGSTNNAIAYDWGNNRAMGRNVVLNQTSTNQSLGYNLFTASTIDGQQGCKDCANPTPTSYAAIGFTNYAGGDYHMSSGTYSGQWAYGRPAGANIDQVNWMTAHAIDGQPNPFLDFKVRSISKATSSVTFTYTAYDSNACTVNLSAFSGGSVLATASDSGGANFDRTLTVSGLASRTRYWYTLICGPSGAYNRVGQLLTH